MLICEVYNQAMKTVDGLKELDTPKADHLLENLEVDGNNNVHANFNIAGNIHDIRLNEKIVRRGNRSSSVFSRHEILIM